MENIKNIDNNISLKEELAGLKESIEKQDSVLENLRFLTTEIATQENEEFDLPLDSQTGRLDMEEYVKRGVYTPENVDGDKDTLRPLEREWLDKITPNNKEENIKKEINGEKVELSTMITLYKFLNKNFIVTRAAKYDDIDNGVDTVIFNKDTGKIVCAVDESDMLVGRYAEDKKQKILNKNKKGGAWIKYGLKLNNNNPKKIEGALVRNIPLFELAMGLDELNKHFSEVTDDLSNVSEFDSILFHHFMNKINEQTTAMQEPTLKIPLEVQQTAKTFVSQIERLYPNIFYSEDIIVSRKQGMLKSDFYTLSKKITNDQERDVFREIASK